MIKPLQTKEILLKDIKFLDFNRAVKMAQVDKLLASMRIYGQQRLPVVVRVNLDKKGSKYYCIDGQHMISALIKDGSMKTLVSIAYTDSKKEIVGLMSTLNNVVCVWSVEDYVNAFCSLKMEDYLSLKTYKFATGFTYPVCAIILGSSEISDIKRGEFKSNNKDTDILTKNLIDVCAFVDSSSAKLMTAYIRFFRSPSIDYNHEIFMAKLAKNKKSFIIAHDTTLMKSQFEKIYES